MYVKDTEPSYLKIQPHLDQWPQGLNISCHIRVVEVHVSPTSGAMAVAFPTTFVARAISHASLTSGASL
jgi:hypothetical protein